MTKKSDDLSSEHLSWLVASRSRNQECSLILYQILVEHSATLRKHDALADIAQGLVAVSFSLWRAVFLGDRIGSDEALMDDAEQYLGKIILDNAIGYLQDRNAREWTWHYYLNNARYRLEKISKINPDILPARLVVKKPRPRKKQWEFYQKALFHAVEGLGDVLNESA